MKLTDYLTPDHIVTGFTATDKASALAALCRLAADSYSLDYQTILQVVMDREALGSTGLGGGVALPHGQSPGLDHSVLLMAISTQGVDFDSIDGRPVKLFVFLLSPKDVEKSAHLQLLACLGRFLKSPGVVDEMLAASGPEHVFRLLLERE